ncbi:MAG: hypothetical protein WC729_11480 [Sphingomonas sp.]|jgi:hypothetical protein|uniref:hypothetical protein n=1 Tax=Sphingomonas sp. TaxID=28214 RepID=UPI00356B1BDD
MKRSGGEGSPESVMAPISMCIPQAIAMAGFSRPRGNELIKSGEIRSPRAEIVPSRVALSAFSIDRETSSFRHAAFQTQPFTRAIKQAGDPYESRTLFSSNIRVSLSPL